MNIGIINLNSGNLLSVVRAVENVGFKAFTIDKPCSGFDALIMPGQGRFAFIVSAIDDNGWRDFIVNWIKDDKKFIGICVGMQVLFESSAEDKKARGLGVLNGQVNKLQHPVTPMVGWAKLASKDHLMHNQYVYFVNSYAITNSQYCIARVNYGSSFCAAIQKGNLYGFQFHPEKSGNYGQELLRTCLN
ncbi:MAG: imidazole glycerol phosphate synthase subunit HisH [Proteobacteria bacterium]|nr:imidazole glycerol phosphate synthase subunit HisH [Pseudomonadota bacterium]